MRRLVTTLATVAAAALLTGCSVSVSDRRDQASPSSTPTPTVAAPDWSKLPGSWGQIITNDIEIGNCDGLQASFDAFDGMGESARERDDYELSEYATSAMAYLHEQMTQIGCYS